MFALPPACPTPRTLVLLHLPTTTPQAAWHAIRDMVVRGAPAIAVAGALALARELAVAAALPASDDGALPTVAAVVGRVEERCAYLVTSRPTAVNLEIAARHLVAVVREGADATPPPAPAALALEVAGAADRMLARGVAQCRAMSRHAADLLLELTAPRTAGRPLRILTHCNTGALATAGWGTALGAVRELHSRGLLERCYASETRPYLQGARLTAFELASEGIPGTLICDSTAASLMRSGAVDAVVVGADRVAANGDTANKIGTYSHAVSAAHHGLPFVVVAPLTTLDAGCPDGAAINIEDRPPEEVTHARAAHGTGAAWGERVAATGVDVFNPSFDVTPHGLLAGVVTERGCVARVGAAWGQGNADAASLGPFRVGAHLRDAAAAAVREGNADANGDAGGKPGSGGAGAAVRGLARLPTMVGTGGRAGGAAADDAGDDDDDEAPRSIVVPDGYADLDEASALVYVAERPALARRVGPPGSEATWTCHEAGGDAGNINYIFLITGPSGGVVIKQARPYIRIVGEGWPLPQVRLAFEAACLRQHRALCPDHVPEVYCHDPRASVMAMELLAPPMAVVRFAVCREGRIYPEMARHAGSYVARAVAGTSTVCVKAAEHTAAVRAYDVNLPMRQVTERVTFDDPFTEGADGNKHTTPQLDGLAAKLRSDAPLRAAVARCKRLFVEKREALCHGDLHTGSLMARCPKSLDHAPALAKRHVGAAPAESSRTVVLDAEFAFYGPIGLDLGDLVAHLLLSALASDGWEAQDAARGDADLATARPAQRAWLLRSAVESWEAFEAGVRALDPRGEGLPGAHWGAGEDASPAVRAAALDAWLAGVLADTLAFTALEIIRRLLGIARIEDTESIENADHRAACESRALRLARAILLEPERFCTVAAVVEALEVERGDGAEPRGKDAGL